MNEENIRKRLRILLNEIQNEVDPVLLNRCRSLFRKEVSFFRRSYMAAYLLLLDEEGKAAVTSGHKTRDRGSAGRHADKNSSPEAASAGKGERSRRDRKSNERPAAVADKTRSRERSVENSRLSEEESARLFISIGRNRKIFPREILALVNAKAQIARDDIGAIRILDNYSFVQVRTSEADKVIAALHGQNFRGRALTVSYARSRGEGDDESPEPGEKPDYRADSQADEQKNGGISES